MHAAITVEPLAVGARCVDSLVMAFALVTLVDTGMGTTRSSARFFG